MGESPAPVQAPRTVAVSGMDDAAVNEKLWYKTVCARPDEEE